MNIGSLSCPQELNLKGSSKLEALPDSVEKHLSLTLLNLSFSESLVNLPLGLQNVTRFVELDLNCFHFSVSITFVFAVNHTR